MGIRSKKCILIKNCLIWMRLQPKILKITRFIISITEIRFKTVIIKATIMKLGVRLLRNSSL